MKVTPHESVEQECVFRWAAMNQNRFPDLEWMFHIPNGGTRNATEAECLRRQGVKAGIADICLPVARGGYHALYIELKRIKGSRKTKDQEDFINAMNARGNLATFAYGWQQAVEIITDYLNYPKNP